MPSLFEKYVIYLYIQNQLLIKFVESVREQHDKHELLTI